MNTAVIPSIFAKHGLPAPRLVERIAVGFTNEVYSIDDQYILKVCQEAGNEVNFEREARFYEFFAGKLPVPEVLAYDRSKSLVPCHYLLYSKIKGDNLYNVWHTYSHEQRRAVVRQLCELLRTVNKTNVAELPPGTVEPLDGWKGYITGKIEGYLQVCERAGTLSAELVADIRGYVARHAGVLDQANIALVYWDAHFDNILVDGDHISGLIDFERTELASIDYALDVAKRMVDKPSKYMSQHAKQFVKNEDYADLLDMYREFYPEAFDFDDMDTRLNLYILAHDLRDLSIWPELTELITGIEIIMAGQK